MEIFDALRRLDLPIREYAVFGSGPLIVRGVVPFKNDLDVICRGGAWDAVRDMGEVSHLPDYDQEIVSLENGTMTFGTAWGIGKFDSSKLIDTAELIHDLPFVRLEFVVRYKEIRSSAKDRIHLEAMRAAGLLDTK